MPAPAPARATLSKSITRGIFTVPASFYAGAEESAFSRHEYAPDGREVGRVNAIKTEEPLLNDAKNTLRVALNAALDGKYITQEQFDRVSKFTPVETIDFGEIIKAVDTEAGLVAVSDSDLASLDLGIPDSEQANARIVCFQPLSILGTGSYVPENIMQVRPKREKGKVNSSHEKAFATLLKAMRNKAVFALLQWTDRNKVKNGALMGNGRLWVLKYDEEVREDLPLPKVDVDPAEVKMMGDLIEASLEQQPRTLADLATALAWEFVNAKIADGKVMVPREGVTPEAAQVQATSLMETLKASVEAARSEVTSE